MGNDLRERRTCRYCGYKWVDEYGEYRTCPNCSGKEDDEDDG